MVNQVLLMMVLGAAWMMSPQPIVHINGTSFPLDVPRVDDSLTIRAPLEWIPQSSKSRYRHPASNSTDALGSCVPVQIQMVFRHGTRNPTASSLSKLYGLKDRMRELNCTGFGFLTEFKLPQTVDAGIMTTQGHVDLIELAQRMASSYPHLISDRTKISWQATNVSRALASGASFMAGLKFSDSEIEASLKSLFDRVVPKRLDADLRPFECCESYIAAVAGQKDKTPPDLKFRQGHFPAIAQKVAKFLGIDSLLVDDITRMFDACQYQNTVQGIQGEFCALFNKDEILLSDFALDLALNFESGYQIPINEHLACSLLTSLNDNIELVVRNASAGHTAVFKFAHAETITPLITTLGLFRDSPLISPVWEKEQIDNRKFRASAFAPYSANIMFELLKCGVGEGEYHVRILVNEVAVKIPGCPGSVCKLETFRSALAGKIGCDFDGAVCRNTVGSVGGAATYRDVAAVPWNDLLTAIGEDGVDFLE